MKKAQSISINTIVIAAIALIVLVLMIAILSGNIKIFNTGTQTCTSLGGDCNKGTTADGNCQANFVKIKASDCDPCCMDIFDEPEDTEPAE